MGVRCRPGGDPGRRRGRALGRRPPARALAAWACAAGSGLVAWGLGTEAPTQAEMVKTGRRHRDLLRTLGTRLPPEAPAAAGTQTHLSQRSQNALSALICAQIVFGVRSGLRHPRLRSSAAGQGWSPTRAIARVSGTPSISRLVIVAARAPGVPFDRSLSAMANTTP